MPSKLDTVPAPGASENVLSVGELTRRIKALLERSIDSCWVRGEISNLRKQSSGHIYFTLKDRDSQLPCVLFRQDAMRCRVELADGRQVVLYGDLSVYEPHGRYQFVGRELIEDGAGRLQLEFERLKQKLAQEGLFAQETKKLLPQMPRCVGIITSPTGAALKDFLSILRRRDWRGRVIILPAKVQGKGAAEAIVQRILDAEQLGGIDLLVAGRGGGSLEDLWCFNEEVVARAIAKCPIPIISAVGHEIDFTLSDFAADKRAETPSAAAELISSAYLDSIDRVKQSRESMSLALERKLADARNRMTLLRSELREHSPVRRIQENGIKLDDLGNHMAHCMRGALFERNNKAFELGRRLREQSPDRRLELAQITLQALAKRYAIQRQQGLDVPCERLEKIQKRLESASLPRALQRGFTVVRDEGGKLVTGKTGLQKGDMLAIDFADGEAHVEVTETGD